MKKKSLSVLLGSFMAVALTGVGFASWIIVQGDTKVEEGTVNVEKIDDMTVTITPTWADNDGDGIWEGATENEETEVKEQSADTDDAQLSFGTNNKANSGWLRNTDGKIERKSLSLGVAVANHSYATEIKVTFKVSNAANYASVVTNKYISGITLDGDTIPTADDTANSVTAGTLVKTYTPAASLSLTIGYEWGETFGNVNPYDFYNGKASSATVSDTDTRTWAKHAQESLTDLYDSLNGLTFSLTIESIVE